MVKQKEQRLLCERKLYQQEFEPGSTIPFFMLLTLNLSQPRLLLIHLNSTFGPSGCAVD